MLLTPGFRNNVSKKHDEKSRICVYIMLWAAKTKYDQVKKAPLILRSNLRLGFYDVGSRCHRPFSRSINQNERYLMRLESVPEKPVACEESSTDDDTTTRQGLIQIHGNWVKRSHQIVLKSNYIPRHPLYTACDESSPIPGTTGNPI